VLTVLAAGALAACQSGGTRLGGGGGGFSLGGPQPFPQSSVPTGQEVKIALLLPLSSRDTRLRSVAKSLKEAAELALFDFSTPGVTLVPKDTRGTGAGASFAAREAIQEGASLIIGPLVAPAVSAAGQEARKSGVPVIAFSTTESVAGNGVYLLSFPPSLEIERIVNYAMARGLKRFAALVPSSGYGNVVAGDVTRIVQEKQGTLFTVERFSGGASGAATSADRVARVAKNIDAVLIADGAPNVQPIAQRLSAGGSVQLIGTGVWNDPSLAAEPALQGAWFPAPGAGTRQVFENRYRSTYGRSPESIASLAYDAVSLAVALSRSPGFDGSLYSAEQLTAADGFCGADGQFRFRADGRVERSLAIMEVSAGGFRMIDPAPVNCAPS
jgi:ABC-type branched-subunit amino acid transport system substrate-binding protein